MQLVQPKLKAVGRCDRDTRASDDRGNGADAVSRVDGWRCAGAGAGSFNFSSEVAPSLLR